MTKSKKPIPATQPITIKGNFFYRDDSRFVIKGICYYPPSASRPETPDKAQGLLPTADLLSDSRLDDLQRDIAAFRELGLNSISVSDLDPSENHTKALSLLSKAGIYVLVRIFNQIDKPNPQRTRQTPTPDFSTEEVYQPSQLRSNLLLIDQLAEHPNVLAFIVNAETIVNPATSKLAEVYRAAVRDAKHFLRARDRRRVPVGVTTCDLMSMKTNFAQYFTAGPAAERVDFYSSNSWTWAHKSSFTISGWENLVNSIRQYPLPMFLSEYGSYTGRRRIWSEVECLFSPDMTGVFSGGCMYTYHNGNNSNYSIVEIGDGGEVEKRPEFKSLLKRWKRVNRRKWEEIVDVHVEMKHSEDWIGQFPPSTPQWLPTSILPPSPLNVEDMAIELVKGRDSPSE